VSALLTCEFEFHRSVVVKAVADRSAFLQARPSPARTKRPRLLFWLCCRWLARCLAQTRRHAPGKSV